MVAHKVSEVYEMWRRGEIVTPDPDDPRTYEYLGISEMECSELLAWIDTDPANGYDEEIDKNDGHLKNNFNERVVF